MPDALLRDRLPGLHHAAWQAYFLRPRPGIVLLAEGDDGLRGVAAVWLRGTLAYVDNLHIRPGLNGGGLGRRLLGAAVGALVARGATRAALTIIEGNDGALRFYRRLGGTASAPHASEVHGEAVLARRIVWAEAARLVRACTEEGAPLNPPA